MRLSPTDWDILDYLSDEGTASPSMIADDIDKSDQYVRESLRDLNANLGLVDRPARGVYQLSERGKQALMNRDKYPGSEFEDAIAPM